MGFDGELDKTYTYDLLGRLVSKVGGDVWADSGNTYLRGFELISSDDYFYLYNIRGDVIQLLDYDGEVVKTYDYDAYGNELSRDLSDENPFRYCGEYYDTETGLIYLRARYYDPSVGRFTSVDPAKDGLNWYVYCNENPIMYTDSSGLRADDSDKSGYNKQLTTSLSANIAFYELFGIPKSVVASSITNASSDMLKTAGEFIIAALASVGIDGPLPFGDAVAIGLIIIAGGISIYAYSSMLIEYMSIPTTKEEAETKDVALTKPNNQAYFPTDPYDFKPSGLYRREFAGGGNGQIIKWFDPITNIPIFEWDEDFKYGSHYHALKIEWKGEHYGPHFDPGSPVPEPWNTIYFSIGR